MIGTSLAQYRMKRMTTKPLRKLLGLLSLGYLVSCLIQAKRYLFQSVTYLVLFISQVVSVYKVLLVLQVFLKQGPYGYYIQVGEDRKGASQKRASLSDVIIILLCTLSFQKLSTDVL